MASALDAAMQTIESRVNTEWGVSTTIAWPETKFIKPATGAWIEPTILLGDATISTKNGRNLIPGVLSINIFAPQGAGLGLLRRTADTVRDIANRIEVSGVSFHAPSGLVIVPKSKDGLVQGNVSVNFLVQEIVT